MNSYTAAEMINHINELGYEKGKKVFDALSKVEKALITAMVKEESKILS